MSAPHSPNALSNSVAIPLTAKLIVLSIIFVFLLIVFFIILHLYDRWSAIPPPSYPSRRRRSRFVFSLGGDSPRAPCGGLEASVLRTLPAIAYRSVDFQEGLECAVCLCAVSDGEKARLLPNCNHGFHLECIDMWFHSHSTCPLCRTPVAPPLPDCWGDSELEVSVVASVEEPSGGLNYPSNFLFSGTQDQVSAGAGPSSSLNNMGDGNGQTVVNFPARLLAERVAVASWPCSVRLTEEAAKCPIARLMSLKGLLSRERRLVDPCSSRGGGDIEHGERGSNPATHFNS